MTRKRYFICLFASLWIAGCGVVPSGSHEFNGPQAGDLIRRNLLLGEEQFSIENPLAYQYGNVHLDGPSGGLLYRFSSSAEFLPWLIERHGLQEFMIDAADELPLDFIEERPPWWDPWNANPSAYFHLVEALATGGERWLIIIFDRAANVLYAVEHYADMPGI